MKTSLLFGLLFSFILGCSEKADKLTQQNPDYVDENFLKPGVISNFTVPEIWPIFYDRAPINLADETSKSMVVIIGSGNPTPNPSRYGPCLVVIANDVPYFIDAGEGIWRGISRVILKHGDFLTSTFSLTKMKYLFVTHLHADHTIGIPSFILHPIKWGSKQEKVIFGPYGTKDMITNILKAWKIEIDERPITATAAGSRPIVTDIKKDGVIYKDDNVTVEAFKTEHSTLDAYAYRITTPDRIFAFSGDSRYSDGLIKAAEDADFLFTEAVTMENIDNLLWGGDSREEKIKEISKFHMFPNDLITLKKKSNVKNIVLIHEQNYLPVNEYFREGLLEEIKKAGLKGPIYSSIDGDIYY